MSCEWFRGFVCVGGRRFSPVNTQSVPLLETCKSAEAEQNRLRPFPIKRTIYGGIASAFGGAGQVIVCGGYTGDEDISNKCYMYVTPVRSGIKLKLTLFQSLHPSGSWETAPSMNKRRLHAAAATVYERDVWVLGGQYGNNIEERLGGQDHAISERVCNIISAFVMCSYVRDIHGQQMGFRT